MWRELRAWRWVIGFGVVAIWWLAGAPPFGPFNQQQTSNSAILDDSWDCRPVKGGPICWKKLHQNIPASSSP